VTTQTKPSELAPSDRGPERKNMPARLLRKLAESPEAGVMTACVLVFFLVSLKAPTYHNAGNLQVMARDLSQTGILAIGEALVILTGGIDLSVGALAGLAGILCAWFNVHENVPAPLSILLTLAICAAVGFWHGTMVTKLQVAPFVITLVTLTVSEGLALAITTGTPINGISSLFTRISHFQIGQVPIPGIIFLLAVAITWFVLERTYIGRQIYAVGGNREAARLAGIPTARRIVSTYVVSGLLAGVVGVLVIGRMDVADPSVGGSGWELVAIAAAVVGGVALTGGEGRIVGVAAGAILLEFITNGLLAMRVSPYFTQVVQGAVLGIAILADRLRARRFGSTRR
jgi:ribose transport system permease protein